MKRWEVDGKTPTYLKWNGERFPRDHALGLILYAGLLPILGLRASIICKHAQITDIKIALDALPHSSLRGTKLLNAITEADPDIQEMWRNNQRDGQRFEFGVLQTYQNEQGIAQPAKTHPTAILVDWLAAACMAKIDPEQLQAEGGFDDAEVREIGAIWDAAYEYGSASLLDLDDSRLMDRVKQHVARRLAGL